MQHSKRNERFSSWDFVYAVNMGFACLISFWVITFVLVRFVDKPSDLLGGMWAVAATIFVFRDTHSESLSAGVSRLIATSVSFALCLAYLLVFPFTAVGMAIVLAVGTVVMALSDRRGDIITTGITTAVVMVVAALSPQDAWHQPLLRLVDTVVGIAVGVSCKWIASFLFYRLLGKPAR
jgi:uncharacterized membrane protein YccC